MDHDREEAKASAKTARLDLVTVEVLRNALPAIATEMAIDLRRTSYNMMIYEVQDFCCAAGCERTPDRAEHGWRGVLRR